MADPAARYSDVDNPAEYGFDAYAEKSDTVDLTNATRGLYVGSTGDVKVDLVGSGTVTFKNVQAGTLLPIRVKRLYSTGTGVTDAIGLY